MPRSIPLRISPPATMPQSPTMDPTERSIPPVMMTNVMPMARKALSATCFDIKIQFAVERKFGAAIEKNTKTAMRAINVLSFMMVRSMEPEDRSCVFAELVMTLALLLIEYFCALLVRVPERRPRQWLPHSLRGDRTSQS